MERWSKAMLGALGLACAGWLSEGCNFDLGGGGDDDGPDVERFDKSGSTELPLSDGPQGFVSNPENSRNTLKLVWPRDYAGNVDRVTAFDGSGYFYDELYRELPNEHDGRPRYYGTKPIGIYPSNLTVRVIFDDQSIAHVVLPIPQQRYD